MPIPIRNMLYMAASALRWRLTGRRRPLNIMLAVTDRCTNRCAICRIPALNRPDLPLPDIQRILDDAAAMGCQRLGIWGGEPLVRRDLGDIIRRAKQRKMFVTVDTNGHLLPESDELLAGADHLNISLDGNREANDAIRGAGSFDKTMRGLAHARRRYPFWTLTVLTKSNLGDIDWLLNLAREQGFRASFQVLHHNDYLGCNEEFHPDEQALREAIHLLIRRKREGWPVASSFGYLEHLLRWSDFRVIRRDTGHRPVRCAAGELYCNIDVNGDVYPCSLLVGEQAAPNAAQIGFRAAFAQLAPISCAQCLAACFTEYNLLYSLDWRTAWNWVRALGR